MNKLKSKIRKAVKKRYKQTRKNNFIRKKAFKGHILEKKSSKRKRNLSHSVVVTFSDLRAIRRMLLS
jgi:large subunit ribosomal protein L35|uniref:Large ribosomal subunit protein bL35c n=1 Tax=Vaucheria litorea TaxID=109269 RepID=B7T1Y8_VAULI|nr:ribosomal protein L35 [Vaucheria litorea]ACF70954.1 ribosomal protein L35 [Vaucheria litorea]